MPKKTTPNVGISEIKEFQGKLGNKDSHYNKLIGLYQQLLTQKTVGNLNEILNLDTILEDFLILSEKIKNNQVRAINWLQYSEVCFEVAKHCHANSQSQKKLVLQSIQLLASKRLIKNPEKIFSLLKENYQLILPVFPKDSFENQLFNLMCTICEKTKIDLTKLNPMSFLSGAIEKAVSANPKNEYLLEHLSAFIKFLTRFGRELPNADWRAFVEREDISQLDEKLKSLPTQLLGNQTASQLSRTQGGPFATQDAPPNREPATILAMH